MRLFPLLIAVALLGACGPAPEELGLLQPEIINGQQDQGHPAVGSLQIANAGSCTATLVGSRTVLTAAHCVTLDKQAPYNLASPLFFIPGKPGAPKIQVISAQMHPSFDYSDVTSPDLAVVKLAQPMVGITPMPVSKQPPTSGEKVWLVGYGQTSTQNVNSGGTKHKAATVIAEVAPTTFTFHATVSSGGSICWGDSGGPSIAVRNGIEIQIGVHAVLIPSAPEATKCESGGINSRVDAFYDWIAKHAGDDLYKGAGQGGSDTQLPQVQILSPHDRSQLGPSFEVQVDARDDVGIARVELFFDGQLQQTREQPPFAFRLDNRQPGFHTIRADAVDQANRRASHLVQIHVAGSGSVPIPGQPQPNQPYDPSAPATEFQMLGSCSAAGSSSPACCWPILVHLLLLLVTPIRRRFM
jgi:V8-like Glu-specific endopeptidase